MNKNTLGVVLLCCFIVNVPFCLCYGERDAELRKSERGRHGPGHDNESGESRYGSGQNPQQGTGNNQQTAGNRSGSNQQPGPGYGSVPFVNPAQGQASGTLGYVNVQQQGQGGQQHGQSGQGYGYQTHGY